MSDYEFVTRYSRNDLKLAARSIWKKRVFRIRDVLISLLIVFGCIGLVFGRNENIYSVAIAGISILITFWAVRWFHYRKLLRKIQLQTEAILDEDIRVILTHDSILMLTAHGEVRNLWKDTTEIWNQRVFFVFFGDEYMFFYNIDLNTRKRFLERVPQHLYNRKTAIAEV